MKNKYQLGTRVLKLGFDIDPFRLLETFLVHMMVMKPYLVVQESESTNVFLIHKGHTDFLCITIKLNLAVIYLPYSILSCFRLKFSFKPGQFSEIWPFLSFVTFILLYKR